MADLSARQVSARHAGLALIFGLGLLTQALACSGTADGKSFGPDGSEPPGSDRGGDDEGPSFLPDTGTSPDEGFEECATASQEATLVPLNMLIMFDRSGSMQDNNKWNKATAALKAFIQDEESADLRVALRFFPDDACNDDTCDVSACSAPLIEAAPLTEESGVDDPQEEALVTAIDAEDPYGNATPIYPALAGAEKWATNYRASHAAEKAIVILVTDGTPNGCDEDVAAIASLAADAFTTSDVLTYGVGLVGSDRDITDEIARQGGTEQGFYIGNGDAQADLLAALKSIQNSQVACEFQMPTSTNGDEIDPLLVNVTYTAGNGAQAALGQVPNQGACDPRTGGWYYDSPNNPSIISFCPSTCHVVQADPAAKVQILMGCGTRPAR